MFIAGTSFPEQATIQGTPNFALAVPADATVLSNVRSIQCLTAGTLQAKNAAGATIAIPLLAGAKLEISPIAIMTATTGTYLLLLA